MTKAGMPEAMVALTVAPTAALMVALRVALTVSQTVALKELLGVVIVDVGSREFSARAVDLELSLFGSENVVHLGHVIEAFPLHSVVQEA